MIETLKKQIIQYNKEYREGTPSVSDQEYDMLLELLQDKMPVIEFEAFRATLADTTDGKDIKHLTVIGSLDKVKAEDKVLPEVLKKICPSKRATIMPKVDGMSFVATYKKGRLFQVASRGDGYVGEDMTAKARFILPATIDCTKDIREYRGEFTLTGNDHEKLGYKNRRNGTVGVMKAKTWDSRDVALVKGIVYQEISSTEPRSRQLIEAQRLGFTTVTSYSTTISSLSDENVTQLLKEWRTSLEYDIDGLVICDEQYVAETDQFIPKGMFAYKVNDQVAVARCKGIEWNTSKNGLVKPVVLIESVELCGCTVSRVSGYNARNIISNEIGVGADLEIVRSGDVIPKILRVLKPGKVEYPENCPSCGEQLGLGDVDLLCTNENCGKSSVMKVQSFIKTLGIENASAKSFEKWGIEKMDDLVTWKPGKGKAELAFYEELLTKMFTRKPYDLMAAMNWNGAAGVKSAMVILNHFGDTLAKNTWRSMDFPAGIGERTMEVFMSCFDENVRILEKIVMDERYEPVEEEVKEVKQSGITGKSFCITGTLSKPRKHFETIVTDNGGTLGSVSKKLDFLIVGADAGSKEDKAKKLGIKIISEQEFLAMI